MSHFFPEHKTKGRFSSIDSLQNAWKIFVLEPLFFHWSCIGFSGSVALFCGIDRVRITKFYSTNNNYRYSDFMISDFMISDFMLPVYETDFIGYKLCYTQLVRK